MLSKCLCIGNGARMRHDYYSKRKYITALIGSCKQPVDLTSLLVALSDHVVSSLATRSSATAERQRVSYTRLSRLTH